MAVYDFEIEDYVVTCRDSISLKKWKALSAAAKGQDFAATIDLFVEYIVVETKLKGELIEFDDMDEVAASAVIGAWHKEKEATMQERPLAQRSAKR